ncbi:MAG: DinB family protein [Cyclobacteriaceae bacterium]
MKEIVKELNEIVEIFAERIGNFSEADLSEKPLPNKWNKKEVVGHLVDSGQNNLRRFIVGQHTATPPKIVYDQEFWVMANDYQNMAGKDVIALWKLVNKQISNVLTTMESDKYLKTCDTSKEGEQLRSLEWLADDYVKHLKHHLNQVIKDSFDITYP